MRAKQRLAAESAQAQHSTLDHELSGRPFDGFRELLASPYARSQAWFILLMSWVSTVAYFFQTDLIARSFQALESRAQAIADIDLVVNILSALILIFGLGRLVQRFGVTAGLVLNPIIMVIAFLAIAFSPVWSCTTANRDASSRRTIKHGKRNSKCDGIWKGPLSKRVPTAV